MIRREPSGCSPAATASVLLREYGARRAVALAETTAASLAAVSPAVALLYADAARIIERSFVAADLAQARCGQ